MKTKKLFLMAAMLLMSVCSFAQNGNTPLKGDVNGDGKVDVADIVAILKIMKDAGGQGESKENTVTFIDRGTILKTITGQEGTSVTAPEVSAWSGHNFVGWNETESAGVGGQVITAIGTSDVTYYAQWQEQTTYYWYAGQTQPTSMTSNPTVDDSNFTNNKWHTLGNATTIAKTITGGTSGLDWYVAVPTAVGLKATAGDLSTPDTSWDNIESITINSISYTVWRPNITGTRCAVYMAK